MNKCTSIQKQFIVFIAAFISMTSLYATTQPKFTLIPTTPTTINVVTNQTATVIYTVTNTTQITRELTIKPLAAGITQTTTGNGVCSNPFTLAHNQSCSLTLQINGSQLPSKVTGGPVVCSTMGYGDNSPDPFLCSQPSQSDILNITQTALASISVSPSQLSIDAGGFQGTLTVTNNSNTTTATNVAANFSGTLLDGHITQDASNCQTLAPKKSCTLTFTSGNVGVPLTSFPIQGDNTSQTTASIVIVFPTVATIEVSGSPLYLLASSTPITEYLEIHNTNTLLTAEGVAATLTGDLLTEVVQDPDACRTIPPLGYCSLAFTPIANGTAVALTTVDILGTNTTTVQAQIAVNSVAQVPISVTSGSPAILVADGISNKTMVITNNSSTDAALNVAPIFTGTALDGNVTTTATGCSSIAPNGGTCTIKFTAKTTQVPATPFTIQGSNTATATPTPVIIIGPPLAVLKISPNPAVLDLETNGSAGTFTISNLSLQVDAQNIVPTLSTLMASSVTLTNGCSPTLLRNSSCTMTFTPLSTAVALESFPIKGDNTTQLAGSIQIISTSPTDAQIEVVSGNQLALDAPGGTGNITIKNTSSSAINASQISAAISGTALDAGGVTQNASDCITLAQGNTCNLVFTAGSTAVTPPVTVNIFGSNTSITTAQISVNGVPTLSMSPSSISLLANGTETQSTTVTNNSTTTNATNVTADFSGTALEGQVTIVSNTCSDIPPLGSCQITFAAGGNIVPQTTFSVYGTNQSGTSTSVVQGTMSIGSYFAYVSSGTYINRCLMNSVTGLLSNCVDQTVLNISSEPTVLAIDPAGKYLYAAKTNSGIWKCPIQYDGTLGTCTYYSTGLTTVTYTTLSFDPLGEFLYAIANSNQSVQTCRVNTSDGSISNCAFDTSTGYGNWGLAMNNSRTWAYLPSNISPFDIYKCTVNYGELGTCSVAYNFNNVLNGIALSPSNKYAYIPSRVSNVIQRFEIDASSGNMMNPIAYSINDDTCQAAVNSAGTFAYFTDENEPRNVQVCPIGNEGALGTCVNATDVTFGSCYGLALWEHAVPNSP